jgi:pyruvate dehydrogenase E2 component (dihydrolipoamide acetyltransferase)
MSRELRFQDPGEGIHEAEIVEVNVSEGDRIAEDDTVLAVETDKATTEIPSPYSGKVESVAVEVGDQVRVGDLLMSFSAEGPEEPQTPPEEVSESDEGPPDKTEPPGSKQAQPPEGEERRAEKRPVPAAPSTRRLARELGVELAAIEGSGPGGRVLAEDVWAFAEQGAGGPTEEPPAREEAGRPGEKAGAEDYELPDFSQWGEIERLPLRSIRRTTARETARSWARIPHVMHHDLADITELDRFRRAHAAEVEETGGKLTLTVLVMKAAVAALKAFPRFNASLDADDESILLKHYYHLGVAVDTEQGLLVPVVRDIDRKSLVEVALELVRIAQRARKGKLGREEMQGGTFTISNVGGIGGTFFTPIIRHPEAAILGLGRAELQPVVRPIAQGDVEDPKLTARLLLPLCLAFDHRLNDGAEAADFVNHMIAGLQDPETLLLTV